MVTKYLFVGCKCKHVLLLSPATAVAETDKMLEDLKVSDKKEEEKAVVTSEAVAESVAKPADDVTGTGSHGEALSDSVPQHKDPSSALDKLVDEDNSKVTEVTAAL